MKIHKKKFFFKIIVASPHPLEDLSLVVNHLVGDNQKVKPIIKIRVLFAKT